MPREIDLTPPKPPGEFASFGWWNGAGKLPVHLVWSAVHAGALVCERKGPRGGQWFAVTSVEAWAAWVALYTKRAQRQEEGRHAWAVRRILSGEAQRRRGAWKAGPP